MEAVVLIPMFLAVFGGAILSLSVRRRNPGVGAVAGALVLVLILVGVGAMAFPALSPSPEDGPPLIALGELARGLGVLVVIVSLSGAVGVFQGWRLKMPWRIAWFGGVGELIPLSLVMGLLQPGSGSDVQSIPMALPVSQVIWIGFGFACVAAELLAPLVLAKMPRRKGYPRTFDVPLPY